MCKKSWEQEEEKVQEKLSRTLRGPEWLPKCIQARLAESYRSTNTVPLVFYLSLRLLLCFWGYKFKVRLFSFTH